MLFRVAERVKTPLALAGLLVIVLYLVFSRVLALKVLAIVALVLGAGSFVLAMLLKHRTETRDSQVQLVDARLDAHDSPYEQAIVDGERQIRPRKRAAKRSINEGGHNDRD